MQFLVYVFRGLVLNTFSLYSRYYVRFFINASGPISWQQKLVCQHYLPGKGKITEVQKAIDGASKVNFWFMHWWHVSLFGPIAFCWLEKLRPMGLFGCVTCFLFSNPRKEGVNFYFRLKSVWSWYGLPFPVCLKEISLSLSYGHTDAHPHKLPSLMAAWFWSIEDCLQIIWCIGFLIL